MKTKFSVLLAALVLAFSSNIYAAESAECVFRGIVTGDFAEE